MGKSKEMFLADKDAVKQALITLKSPAFISLFNAARAEFSTRNPTAEQGRGVSMFESVLFDMPEDGKEDSSWEEITSGERLDLGLEIPIRHGDRPKPEQTPK